HRADHLVVPLVADEDDRVPLARETYGLGVDLGDQRAGGIDGAKIAFGGMLPDDRGDTVSAIENGAASGDFGDVVDEDDAAGAEALDNRPVMNDLVINVERAAEECQRSFEALDGHV